MWSILRNNGKYTDNVRSLAHQTLTPLGYLFLKSQPDDSLPVADFRTVGIAATRLPIPELFATLIAMIRRQDWICEVAAGYGDPPLEVAPKFICQTRYIIA